MIRPELIPEHVAYSAALYLSEVIEDYFKDPEHQRAFEKWQQEERERKDEEQKNICIVDDCNGVAHNSVFVD